MSELLCIIAQSIFKRNFYVFWKWTHGRRLLTTTLASSHCSSRRILRQVYVIDWYPTPSDFRVETQLGFPAKNDRHRTANLVPPLLARKETSITGLEVETFLAVTQRAMTTFWKGFLARKTVETVPKMPDYSLFPEGDWKEIFFFSFFFIFSFYFHDKTKRSYHCYDLFRNPLG